MLNLNQEVLRCPKCHWVVATQLESYARNDRVEAYVRCQECGTQYWVCYQQTQEVEFSTEKELAEILHVCPKCERPLIPENMDPFDAFDWLLKNDPLIAKAYRQGRHDERHSIKN